MTTNSRAHSFEAPISKYKGKMWKGCVKLENRRVPLYYYLKMPFPVLAPAKMTAAKLIG